MGTEAKILNFFPTNKLITIFCKTSKKLAKSISFPYNGACQTKINIPLSLLPNTVLPEMILSVLNQFKTICFL